MRGDGARRGNCSAQKIIHEIVISINITKIDYMYSVYSVYSSYAADESKYHAGVLRSGGDIYAATDTTTDGKPSPTAPGRARSALVL